jgi:hypothetical protein
VTTDSEPVRLHKDWWGQCRTCKWWAPIGGTREGRGALSGFCECRKSRFCHLASARYTECEQWDSYDVDAAIVVMEMSSEQD